MTWNVNEHLIINGFDTTYTTWIHHGERFSRFYVNSQSSTLPTNNVEDPCPSLASMVNDILEHLPHEVNVEDEVNVEAHVEATTFHCDNKGVNQTQTDLEENVKYKEDLPLRHNLDVMHTEKNCAEILFATIMNTKGKKKDGVKARKDLKRMKIRMKLWLVEKNGKLVLPEAPFCLSRSEREAKGNYTRGLRTFGGYDDECPKQLDRKGKEYFLNTVEYEKYNTYKENFNSLSQSRRGNQSEKHKTTQNSGVSMRAVTSFISRVGDRNPINEEVTYYGIVKSILKLDYIEFKKIVFCCDWVRIEESGCLVDAVTNLRYVNLAKLQRNLNDGDEPFIIESQATQVFYCKDHSQPDEQWHVILDSPKRLSKGVDAYEDPLVFAVRINVDDSILSLVDDVAENNIIEDAQH
ncbi:hypothetical protein GIB67_028404 [Kingdonia uniflora]|uniref:DUF4216 domain-containing protein n=1 Tax=Kingdonia uniflora TaxID=39325 RepID=A0A7J7MI76_9MAGN|nr:hypothetical protein GIB67_028404 [Kingdonia uniflora]